jgi:hypothetical protein
MRQQAPYGAVEIIMKTSRKSVASFCSLAAVVAVATILAVMPASAKFTQIGEDMGKCLQKAMGGGDPPPPPPPPPKPTRANSGAGTAETVSMGNAAASGSPKVAAFKDKMCACKDSACAQ